MASVDMFGNPTQDNPFDPTPGSSQTVPKGQAGDPAYDANPRDAMIARDSNSWLQQLQNATKGLNFGDPNQAAQDELQSVQQQASYAQNAGVDPAQFVNEAIARLQKRGAPGSQTNTPGQPTGFQGTSLPTLPGQFNDPTSQLYQAANQAGLDATATNTPQFTQLMDFLNKQFSSLSQSNGYTPEELQLLQTQAWDPIEQQRSATQQNILRNASLRGILPSSGLVQGEQNAANIASDAQRAAAQRDVAINAINERTNRLNQALGIGQQAVNLPINAANAALPFANNLYQMPRTALSDALAVLGGSSPSAALSPLVALQGVNNQQANLNTQNQQAMLQTIAAYLQKMFGG